MITGRCGVSVAQQATRESHNLKVVISILTRGISMNHVFFPCRFEFAILLVLDISVVLILSICETTASREASMAQ